MAEHAFKVKRRQVLEIAQLVRHNDTFIGELVEDGWWDHVRTARESEFGLGFASQLVALVMVRTIPELAALGALVGLRVLAELLDIAEVVFEQVQIHCTGVMAV